MAADNVVVVSNGATSTEKVAYVALSGLSSGEKPYRKLFSENESALELRQAKKILQNESEISDGQILELFVSPEKGVYQKLGRTDAERDENFAIAIRAGFNRVFEEEGFQPGELKFVFGIHKNTNNYHAHVLINTAGSSAHNVGLNIKSEDFHRRQMKNSRLGEIFAGEFEKRYSAQPPSSVPTILNNAVNLAVREKTGTDRYEFVLESFRTLRKLSEANVGHLLKNNSLYVNAQGGLSFVRRTDTGKVTGYMNENGRTGISDEAGYFYIGDPKTARRFIITDNPKEALSLWELSSHKDLSKVCFVSADDGRTPSALLEHLKTYTEDNSVRIIWALNLKNDRIQNTDHLEELRETLLTNRSEDLPHIELVTFAPHKTVGLNWHKQNIARQVPGVLRAVTRTVAEIESSYDLSIDAVARMLEEKEYENLNETDLFKRVTTRFEKDEFTVYERGENNIYGQKLGKYKTVNGDDNIPQYQVTEIGNEKYDKTKILFREIDLISFIENEFHNSSETSLKIDAEANNTFEKAAADEEVIGDLLNAEALKNEMPSNEVLESNNQTVPYRTLDTLVNKLRTEVEMEDVARLCGLYYRKSENVWIDTEGKNKNFKIEFLKGTNVFVDRVQGRAGGEGVIDLAIHLMGGNAKVKTANSGFINARNFLLDHYFPNWKEEIKLAGEATFEQKNDTTKRFRLPASQEATTERALTYLTDRGISSDVLTYALLDKTIYGSPYGSVVFVHKSPEKFVTGASWRSLESHPRNEVKNSNLEKGWFTYGDLATATRVVITDDPVEALSYVSIKGKTNSGTAVIGLGYNQRRIPEELVNYVGKKVGATLVIATGNTKGNNKIYNELVENLGDATNYIVTREIGGEKVSFGFLRVWRDTPEAGQDWNDLLQSEAYKLGLISGQEHIEQIVSAAEDQTSDIEETEVLSGAEQSELPVEVIELKQLEAVLESYAAASPKNNDAEILAKIIEENPDYRNNLLDFAADRKFYSFGNISAEGEIAVSDIELKNERDDLEKKVNNYLTAKQYGGNTQPLNEYIVETLIPRIIGNRQDMADYLLRNTEAVKSNDQLENIRKSVKGYDNKFIRETERLTRVLRRASFEEIEKIENTLENFKPETGTGKDAEERILAIAGFVAERSATITEALPDLETLEIGEKPTPAIKADAPPWELTVEVEGKTKKIYIDDFAPDDLDFVVSSIQNGYFANYTNPRNLIRSSSEAVKTTLDRQQGVFWMTEQHLSGLRSVAEKNRLLIEEKDVETSRLFAKTISTELQKLDNDYEAKFDKDYSEVSVAFAVSSRFSDDRYIIFAPANVGEQWEVLTERYISPTDISPPDAELDEKTTFRGSLTEVVNNIINTETLNAEINKNAVEAENTAEFPALSAEEAAFITAGQIFQQDQDLLTGFVTDYTESKKTSGETIPLFTEFEGKATTNPAVLLTMPENGDSYLIEMHRFSDLRVCNFILSYEEKGGEISSETQADHLIKNSFSTFSELESYLDTANLNKELAKKGREQEHLAIKNLKQILEAEMSDDFVFELLEEPTKFPANSLRVSLSPESLPTKEIGVVYYLNNGKTVIWEKVAEDKVIDGVEHLAVPDLNTEALIARLDTKKSEITGAVAANSSVSGLPAEQNSLSPVGVYDDLVSAMDAATLESDTNQTAENVSGIITELKFSKRDNSGRSNGHVVVQNGKGESFIIFYHNSLMMDAPLDKLTDAFYKGEIKRGDRLNCQGYSSRNGDPDQYIIKFTPTAITHELITGKTDENVKVGDTPKKSAVSGNSDSTTKDSKPAQQELIEEKAEAEKVSAQTQKVEKLVEFCEDFNKLYPSINLEYGQIGSIVGEKDERTYYLFTAIEIQGEWGPDKASFGGFDSIDGLADNVFNTDELKEWLAAFDNKTTLNIAEVGTDLGKFAASYYGEKPVGQTTSLKETADNLEIEIGNLPPINQAAWEKATAEDTNFSPDEDNYSPAETREIYFGETLAKAGEIVSLKELIAIVPQTKKAEKTQTDARRRLLSAKEELADRVFNTGRYFGIKSEDFIRSMIFENFRIDVNEKYNVITDARFRVVNTSISKITAKAFLLGRASDEEVGFITSNWMQNLKSVRELNDIAIELTYKFENNLLTDTDDLHGYQNFFVKISADAEDTNLDEIPLRALKLYETRSANQKKAESVVKDLTDPPSTKNLLFVATADFTESSISIYTSGSNDHEVFAGRLTAKDDDYVFTNSAGVNTGVQAVNLKAFVEDLDNSGADAGNENIEDKKDTVTEINTKADDQRIFTYENLSDLKFEDISGADVIENKGVGVNRNKNYRHGYVLAVNKDGFETKYAVTVNDGGDPAKFKALQLSEKGKSDYEKKLISLLDKKTLEKLTYLRLDELDVPFNTVQKYTIGKAVEGEHLDAFPTVVRRFRETQLEILGLTNDDGLTTNDVFKKLKTFELPDDSANNLPENTQIPRKLEGFIQYLNATAPELEAKLIHRTRPGTNEIKKYFYLQTGIKTNPASEKDTARYGGTPSLEELEKRIFNNLNFDGWLKTVSKLHAENPLNTKSVREILGDINNGDLQFCDKFSKSVQEKSFFADYDKLITTDELHYLEGADHYQDVGTISGTVEMVEKIRVNNVKVYAVGVKSDEDGFLYKLKVSSDISEDSRNLVDSIEAKNFNKGDRVTMGAFILQSALEKNQNGMQEYAIPTKAYSLAHSYEIKEEIENERANNDYTTGSTTIDIRTNAVGNADHQDLPTGENGISETKEPGIEFAGDAEELVDKGNGESQSERADTSGRTGIERGVENIPDRESDGSDNGEFERDLESANSGRNSSDGGNVAPIAGNERGVDGRENGRNRGVTERSAKSGIADDSIIGEEDSFVITKVTNFGKFYSTWIPEAVWNKLPVNGLEETGEYATVPCDKIKSFSKEELNNFIINRKNCDILITELDGLFEKNEIRLDLNPPSRKTEREDAYGKPAVFETGGKVRLMASEIPPFLPEDKAKSQIDLDQQVFTIKHLFPFNNVTSLVLEAPDGTLVEASFKAVYLVSDDSAKDVEEQTPLAEEKIVTVSETEIKPLVSVGSSFSHKNGLIRIKAETDGEIIFTVQVHEDAAPIQWRKQIGSFEALHEVEFRKENVETEKETIRIKSDKKISLLLPEVRDLSAKELEVYSANAERIELIGFSTMKLSGKTVAVKAIPENLSATDALNHFMELVRNPATIDEYFSFAQAEPERKDEVTARKELDFKTKNFKLRVEKNITRQMIQANPQTVFLFGDNIEETGLGGQAEEMRFEPNTIGIPTKKSPSRNDEAYLTDAEFEINCEVIEKAFDKLFDLEDGTTLVLPSAGIGTGLALLKEKAPKTFNYLKSNLEDLGFVEEGGVYKVSDTALNAGRLKKAAASLASEKPVVEEVSVQSELELETLSVNTETANFEENHPNIKREVLELPEKNKIKFGSDLIPDIILNKIPKRQSGSFEDQTVYVKLFHPQSDWTMFVTEAELVGENAQGEKDIFLYGFVQAAYGEWGSSSLNEIESLSSMLPVERDFYFKPTTFKEAIKSFRIGRGEIQPEVLQTEPVKNADKLVNILDRMAGEIAESENPNAVLGSYVEKYPDLTEPLTEFAGNKLVVVYDETEIQAKPIENRTDFLDEVIDQTVRNQDQELPTIKTAVNSLLRVCDGAVTYDGAGFNGVDAGFARYLGGKDAWDKTDAEQAYKMLKKYSKQLFGFGIEYEALASDLPNYVPREELREARKLEKDTIDRASRKIVETDGNFKIYFNYDPNIVESVRDGIGNAKYRTLGLEKFWEIPVTSESAGKVKDLAENLEFDIEQSTTLLALNRENLFENIENPIAAATNKFPQSSDFGKILDAAEIILDENEIIEILEDANEDTLVYGFINGESIALLNDQEEIAQTQFDGYAVIRRGAGEMLIVETTDLVESRETAESIINAVKLNPDFLGARILSPAATGDEVYRTITCYKPNPNTLLRFEIAPDGNIPRFVSQDYLNALQTSVADRIAEHGKTTDKNITDDDFGQKESEQVWETVIYCRTEEEAGEVAVKLQTEPGFRAAQILPPSQKSEKFKVQIFLNQAAQTVGSSGPEIGEGKNTQKRKVSTKYLNVLKFQNTAGIETTAQNPLDTEQSIRQTGDLANAGIEVENGLPVVPDNFIFTDLTVHQGGEKTKFRRNVEAIRVLKTLEREERFATPEEMEVLSKFVGWGSVKEPFKAYVTDDWKKDRDDLFKLLGDEDFNTAGKVTDNAHHTSIEIAGEIWRAVEKLGFAGGRILEPAVGSGNFLGTSPERITRNSNWFACDIDPSSMKVAKALYPRAALLNTKYEESPWKENTFDLAITNVPFGNYHIADLKYKNLNPTVHNYFFLKMLEQTRPGGLVVALTSRFTMDSEDPKIREALAMRGELLGAVRLHNETFKANAGTEVVTDLLIFRKREKMLERAVTDKGETLAPVIPEGEINWLKTVKIANPNVNLNESEYMCPRTFNLNEFYESHPENILGEISGEGSMYGRKEMTVNPDGQFKEKWDAFVEKLPSGSYQPLEAADNLAISRKMEAKDWLRDGMKCGNLFISENKVYQVEATGEATGLNYTPSQKIRLEKLLELKEIVTDIYKSEIQGTPAKLAEAELYRGELNSKYNSFLKQYGAIKSKANKPLLAGDPDAYRVTNLETAFFEKSGKTEKADIFFKPTISPINYLEKAETTSEAMAASLNKNAALDLDYMASLLTTTPEEVAGRLVTENLAFKNPTDDKWIHADDYLCGNVKRKLADAKLRAAKSVADEQSFARNITALEAIQPEDIPYVDIEINPGSSLLTKEDMYDFIKHLTKAGKDEVMVEYAPKIARWAVGWRSTVAARRYRASEQSREIWGTDDRDVLNILECILQGKSVTVTRTDTLSDGKKVSYTDHEASAACEQKLSDIKAEFKEWVWLDDDRRQRLHRDYNEKRNCFVRSRPNGEHLRLVGINPAIKPYKHQLDYAWRQLVTSSAFAAHEVGAGKTLAMGIAALEMKRIGKANKPMLMCLKSNITQITDEIRLAYPHAKIFSLEEHYDQNARQDAASIIANNEFDLVIMTYNQIEKLPVSRSTQEKYLNQELSLLTETICEAIESEGKKSRLARQLRRRQKNLEAKIENMNLKERDQAITFEETGLDHIFVDEAHHFKSLPIYTTLQNLKGIPTTRSERAVDLHMRCEYLRERFGSPRISPATGTPITNTVAEIYNWMRFCAPDILEEQGLESFDAFQREFTEVVRKLEATATGTYKVQNRLAKFVNVPEMRAMMDRFFDVVTADEAGILRPEARTFVIGIPISAEQIAFRETLRERAENLGHVDPRDDNYFKISSDGEKMSMDMRLVDEFAADTPMTKANILAVNAVRKLIENPEVVQLIFSDSGIHPSPKTGFSIFDEIEQSLINAGIPAERIANVSKLSKEKAREAIKKANDGEILFLMGSTKRLGTGVNAQKFIYGMHHLDTTWLPSDQIQRNGRGKRKGNVFADTGRAIYIYNYVTVGGFDEIKYSANDRKDRFIKQVVTNNLTDRVFQDRSDDGFSPAEIAAIASGNDDIKRQVELSTEISDLTRREKMHRMSQLKMRDKLPLLEKDVEDYRTLLNNFKSDLELLLKGKEVRDTRVTAIHADLTSRINNLDNQIKALGKDAKSDEIDTLMTNRAKLADQKKSDFLITIDDKEFTDRTEANRKFYSMVMTSTGNRKIGEYCGFEIFYEREDGRISWSLFRERVYLRHPESKLVHVLESDDNNDYLNHIEQSSGLTSLSRKIELQTKRTSEKEEELKQVREKLGSVFKEQDKLNAFRNELKEVEKRIREFNTQAQRERELAAKLEVREIGKPQSEEAGEILARLNEIMETEPRVELPAFVSRAATEAAIKGVSVAEIQAMYDEQSGKYSTEETLIDEEDLELDESDIDQTDLFADQNSLFNEDNESDLAENINVEDTVREVARFTDESGKTSSKDQTGERSSEEIFAEELFNEVYKEKLAEKEGKPATGNSSGGKQTSLFDMLTGPGTGDVMASLELEEKFTRTSNQLRGKSLSEFWFMVSSRTDSNGRVYLNAGSYEIVRRAYERGRIAQEGKEFWGTFNEPPAVEAIQKQLTEMKKENRDFETTFGLLQTSIEKAKNERGTVTFIKNMKALAHESLHEGSFHASGGKAIEERHALLSELENHEAMVLASEKIKTAYPYGNPAFWVEELAAHCAAKENHLFDVGDDLAKSFLHTYFRSYAIKNGFISLNEFKELNDEAKNIRNKIYEERAAAERETDYDKIRRFAGDSRSVDGDVGALEKGRDGDGIRQETAISENSHLIMERVESGNLIKEKLNRFDGTSMASLELGDAPLDKSSDSGSELLLSEQTPEKIDLYMSVPNADGSFIRKNATAAYKDGASIFALQNVGNNRYELFINKKENSIKLALEYPDRTLYPVFDAISAYTANAEVQTVKPAVLELNGDRFTLISRGEFDYNGVGMERENSKLTAKTNNLDVRKTPETEAAKKEKNVEIPRISGEDSDLSLSYNAAAIFGNRQQRNDFFEKYGANITRFGNSKAVEMRMGETDSAVFEKSANGDFMLVGDKVVPAFDTTLTEDTLTLGGVAEMFLVQGGTVNKTNSFVGNDGRIREQNLVIPDDLTVYTVVKPARVETIDNQIKVVEKGIIKVGVGETLTDIEARLKVTTPGSKTGEITESAKTNTAVPATSTELPDGFSGTQATAKPEVSEMTLAAFKDEVYAGRFDFDTPAGEKDGFSKASEIVEVLNGYTRGDNLFNLLGKVIDGNQSRAVFDSDSDKSAYKEKIQNMLNREIEIFHQNTILQTTDLNKNISESELRSNVEIEDHAADDTKYGLPIIKSDGVIKVGDRVDYTIAFAKVTEIKTTEEKPLYRIKSYSNNQEWWTSDVKKADQSGATLEDFQNLAKKLPGQEFCRAMTSIHWDQAREFGIGSLVSFWEETNERSFEEEKPVNRWENRNAGKEPPIIQETPVNVKNVPPDIEKNGNGNVTASKTAVLQNETPARVKADAVNSSTENKRDEQKERVSESVNAKADETDAGKPVTENETKNPLKRATAALGEKIQTDIAIQEKRDQLVGLYKSGDDSRYPIMVDGAKKFYSIGFLNSMAWRNARRIVKEKAGTGEINLLAFQEKVPAETIEKRLRIESFNETVIQQSDLRAQIEKAHEYKKNEIRDDLSFLAEDADRLDKELRQLRATLGDKTFNGLSPDINDPDRWRMMEDAVKRGDLKSFETLDEIERNKGIPRSNYAVSRLLAVKDVALIEADLEDHRLTSFEKTKQSNFVKVEITNKDGKPEIVNWSLEKADEKSARADKYISFLNRRRDSEVFAPLNHYVNPMSPINGKIAWFTQPGETFKAHYHPINFIKNDTGAQILRAIYNYSNTTTEIKAAQADKAGIEAIKNLVSEKLSGNANERTQKISDLRKTAEAAERSVEYEKNIRQKVKECLETSAENVPADLRELEIPTAKYTAKELKFLSESAIELADAKLSDKVLQNFVNNSEMAQAVGENPARLLGKALVTKLEADLKNTELVEEAAVLENGNVELKINEDNLPEMEKFTNLSETAQKWIDNLLEAQPDLQPEFNPDQIERLEQIAEFSTPETSAGIKMLTEISEEQLKSVATAAQPTTIQPEVAVNQAMPVSPNGGSIFRPDGSFDENAFTSRSNEYVEKMTNDLGKVAQSFDEIKEISDTGFEFDENSPNSKNEEFYREGEEKFAKASENLKSADVETATEEVVKKEVEEALIRKKETETILEIFE